MAAASRHATAVALSEGYFWALRLGLVFPLIADPEPPEGCADTFQSEAIDALAAAIILARHVP